MMFHLLLLTVFLGVSESEAGSIVQNKIRCYQCTIEGKTPDESLCTQSDLKICPNYQAFDVCMTNIKKNETGHYTIIKRCALGPCTLSADAEKALFSGSCEDSYNKEMDCVRCCEGDGCNRYSSSAMALFPPVAILLLAIIYLIHPYKCFSNPL